MRLGDTLRNSLFGKWAAAAASYLSGETKFSAKEQHLGADEFGVKRDLGRSFFSRQLPARTRAARIRALSSEGRAVAYNKGWISYSEALPLPGEWL